MEKHTELVSGVWETCIGNLFLVLLEFNLTALIVSTSKTRGSNREKALDLCISIKIGVSRRGIELRDTCCSASLYYLVN